MAHRARKLSSVRMLSVLIPTILLGETIHTVTPDTRGNKIELTVANASTAVAAESIVVAVSKTSPRLTFARSDQFIRRIQSGEEAVVAFQFDVGRSAPLNKRDTLEFRVSDRDGSLWTKSIVVQYAGPATFGLDQNFPNPFNPSTAIYYQLPMDSRVSLKVYDILGREVATLVNEDKTTGYYDAKWEATNVSSGVYFYRIEAQPFSGGRSFHSVKKLIVLK